MLILNKNITQQLTDIYLSDEEYWHTEKLDYTDSLNYFNCLLNRNRIQTVTYNGKLIGYVESWRLNFEQFGRIICNRPFSAMEEDINTGNIAYVANVWVHKDYRRSVAIQILKHRFFELNQDCDYFVGEAKRKKVGLVKVFNRKDFYNKLNKGEANHG